MKIGDLVSVINAPRVSWEYGGELGVVVEYFPTDEDRWSPGDALVLVLIKSQLTFFYENELHVLNK